MRGFVGYFFVTVSAYGVMSVVAYNVFLRFKVVALLLVSAAFGLAPAHTVNVGVIPFGKVVRLIRIPVSAHSALHKVLSFIACAVRYIHYVIFYVVFCAAIVADFVMRPLVAPSLICFVPAFVAE